MLIMVIVLRIIVSVSRDMRPMEQNALKVKYVVFVFLQDLNHLKN